MRRDVPAAVGYPQPLIHRQLAPVSTPVQEWVLELPFTTPLSLNDRMVWQVKMGKNKTWRQAAAVLARQQKIPPCRRITVQLCYTPRDDRARDPLNLVASLKACEDGLVDAGIIPDDSSRYHESVMPRITGKGPVRPSGNRLWLVVTAR